MLAAQEKTLTHVELTPATSEQEHTIANLLELCAHDFSEFHHLELNAEGRFGYKHLSLYWSAPDRYPFLIKVNERIAGFALVKKGSDIIADNTVWDVGEFFITRGYRRQGVGMKVAHEMWTRFSGPWEVRVMRSNHAAVNFWRRAIAAFSGREIHPVFVEKSGKSWLVFSFKSRRAA
jgi:predicted acetyltransferase